MKTLGKLLFFGMLLIPVSCRTLTDQKMDSHLERWTVKYKDRGIGWSQSNGGKSWTNEWELKYNEWLSTVPNTIMVDWDIPNDCFDIAISLRWIFAFQNGLALQIGEFKSTDFKGKEIQFLQKAVSKYGTTNASSVTYEIDTSKPEYITTGTVYRFGQTPQIGHTILFQNVDEFGFVNTLEGPYPAEVTVLKASTFFIPNRSLLNFKENEKDLKKATDWDTFRRFYMTVNENGVLKNVISDLFPKAIKHSSDHDFWNCIEKGNFYAIAYSIRAGKEFANVEEKKKILYGDYNVSTFWESLRNFYAYHKEIKTKTFAWKDQKIPKCPHNAYFDPMFVNNPSPKPDPIKPLEMSAKKLCAEIKSRINVVNAGYLECRIKNNSDPKKCSKDPIADHSTPDRDSRLAGYIQQLTGLSYVVESLTTQRPKIECDPMDFHLNLPNTQPLMKTIAIYDGTNGNDIREYFHSLKYAVDPSTQKLFTTQGFPNAFDPKAEIKHRWGCYGTVQVLDEFGEEMQDVEIKCMLDE